MREGGPRTRGDYQYPQLTWAFKTARQDGQGEAKATRRETYKLVNALHDCEIRNIYNQTYTYYGFDIFRPI